MRNRHKIGLGRPATKHKLGLSKVLAAAAAGGAAGGERAAASERILRDYFWLAPSAKSPAPVRKLPAPAAESGASPRIAKKTD